MIQNQWNFSKNKSERLLKTISIRKKNQVRLLIKSRKTQPKKQPKKNKSWKVTFFLKKVKLKKQWTDFRLKKDNKQT